MRPSAKNRESTGREGQARRHPASGFSLPEVLVVMVVAGVLGALVVPHIEVVRFRMDGSARGVMTALVTAQRSAVKRQHDVVVAFDTVSGSIRIHEDANNDNTVSSGERVRTVFLDDQVRFGLGSAPPRPGAMLTVTFAGQQDGYPAVRFRRGGSASEQGTVYLTSDRTSHLLSHARDTRAVQVDRATGRVSWFHYDPAGWKQGF